MIKIIYYISNGNAIKIGIAKNIDKRIKELSTGSSSKLRLLASEYNEDDRKRERELHKQFKDDNMHLEWFRPSKKLINHINKISRYYIEYENNEIMIYNKMSK